MCEPEPAADATTEAESTDNATTEGPEGAAEKVKSYYGGEWTRYHAFFAIMGGYVDKEFRPILPIKHELRQIRIDDFSKKDIQDKSKTNFIARILVLLQTTWFVLRTIARGIRHLPVTELELMTIAFVVLNVVTFYFWWDKPLDVGRPYRITTNIDHGNCLCHSSLPRTINLAATCGAHNTFPERIPPNLFNYLPRKLANMGFGIQQPLTRMDDGSFRVSTFYSGPPSYGRTVRAACGATALASLFGGIHCIAWSFDFPSPVEKILWRSSSVGATIMPLFLGLFHILHISPFMQDDEQSRLKTYVTAEAGSQKWWVSWMVYFGYDVISYLYLFFRFNLLVLPFALLRSAVSEAYHEVLWISFILHL